MDVTAEIHCVSSNSHDRFWPCSPRSPTRNLFRWSRRQPGRAVDSMQFEFLALCVALCNLSLLSLASYLLPPISSWSKGRTRESLGGSRFLCKSHQGEKTRKPSKNPKASLLPQQDVALTKAALGREEDSSDDEEELMAHPWPRHQQHSEDSAIDVCIAGCCCATVQL